MGRALSAAQPTARARLRRSEAPPSSSRLRALGRPGSAPRADARNARHSPAGTTPKAPSSSYISARAVPCDRAPTISLRLEIVKRSDDTKGFVVLPRRGVVERTFSWFGRDRRFAKDFENLAETLGAFVALASIQLALRRLARA
jgi:transposase